MGSLVGGGGGFLYHCFEANEGEIVNLSQLYYFKKLAELQHYTRAAKELYITQPTLSDAISSLEKELGLPLFQRDGRSIKLTPHGAEFYEYVRASLRQLDEGVAAMEARKGDLHGLVNLGMIFTVQDDYLPALLRAYQAEFGSNVSIEIHQAFTNYLTQNLHNETLDLAFCGKRENEPDIAYFPVLNRPLELCVRSGHPLSRRSSVTFDDLRGMRLITYRRGIPIGEQVEKLLEEAALEGVVQNYDDDISMASVISIDGGTGALMLNSVGIKLFSDITMIPIEGVPRDFYWVYLACSKKHYKSGAVRSFIDFVKRFDSDDVDFGHWPEGRPVSTS